MIPLRCTNHTKAAWNGCFMPWAYQVARKVSIPYMCVESTRRLKERLNPVRGVELTAAWVDEVRR